MNVVGTFLFTVATPATRRGFVFVFVLLRFPVSETSGPVASPPASSSSFPCISIYSLKNTCPHGTHTVFATAISVVAGSANLKNPGSSPSQYPALRLFPFFSVAKNRLPVTNAAPRDGYTSLSLGTNTVSRATNVLSVRAAIFPSIGPAATGSLTKILKSTAQVAKSADGPSLVNAPPKYSALRCAKSRFHPHPPAPSQPVV